jgi:hypothetical protein
VRDKEDSLVEIQQKIEQNARFDLFFIEWIFSGTKKPVRRLA